MFVVTERVGAANSEGVQCSGCPRSRNDSYNVSFNTLEHPAPTELNRIVGSRPTNIASLRDSLCSSIIFARKQEYLDLLRRENDRIATLPALTWLRLLWQNESDVRKLVYQQGRDSQKRQRARDVGKGGNEHAGCDSRIDLQLL